jgi:predicted amidohydrolase YtcJ
MAHSISGTGTCAGPAAGRTTGGLVLGVCLLALRPGPVVGAPPDDIFFDGRVVTVDSGFTIVRALAVRDERIVAVGDDASVRAWAGPNTRTHDLGGRMMLPGLIDSHTHPTMAAMAEFDHETWEKEIGTLEVGKHADLVVVDRDLLTCPLDAIKDTKVLETWVDGKRVYRAEDGETTPR